MIRVHAASMDMYSKCMTTNGSFLSHVPFSRSQGGPGARSCELRQVPTRRIRHKRLRRVRAGRRLGSAAKSQRASDKASCKAGACSAGFRVGRDVEEGCCYCALSRHSQHTAPSLHPSSSRSLLALRVLVRKAPTPPCFNAKHDESATSSADEFGVGFPCFPSLGAGERDAWLKISSGVRQAVARERGHDRGINSELGKAGRCKRPRCDHFDAIGPCARLVVSVKRFQFLAFHST